MATAERLSRDANATLIYADRSPTVAKILHPSCNNLLLIVQPGNPSSIVHTIRFQAEIGFASETCSVAINLA